MKADAPEELRRGGWPTPRARLFRKYVLAFVGLVGIVLAANGALDAWFDYGQAKEAATRLQAEKAEAAAERIALFVAEIERQIGWTTHAQWAAGTVEQRRFDYVRLLRQVPAITELVQLDAEGKEQLKVSRLAMDVVGSGADHSAEPRFREALTRKIWFSPVYFRKESEPYLTMAVARSGRNAGVTVAEVNLKLIWDVITTIKVGESGYAFVVDGEGRLVAHPDISLVLRNTDWSRLPQVAAARAAVASRSAPAPMTVAAPAGGPEVLSAVAPTERLGWLVFVELPLREALAPLREALWQSLAVLAAALALSALAGLLLARKMVGPIRQLEAGAARLGGGDLGHRIAVRTGDELERLGDRFNAMAGRLQDSYADLERKVEDRTRELSESLEQQTATADVLKVISRSTFDLRPVLDALVESAARLCAAQSAFIFLRDGDVFRLAANHGFSHEFEEYRTKNPITLDRGTLTGRTALEGRAVHILDAADDPEFTSTESLRLGGFRTMLGVPLMREGTVLGVAALTRAVVEPFTAKQIELVTTFADQAVIAIENVRLFDEVQARTRELSESLEYQTATSDVLNVISRSPSELQPVLDTIVQTAARLCSSEYAFIVKCDGTECRLAAANNVELAHIQFLSRKPVPISRDSVTGRVAVERRTIHVPDVLADPEFKRPDWQEVGKQRTVLGVPLLREGALVGVIILARTEVRPFTAKQVELVTTFADQAVIAIENVRLFDEVQARTGELARSVEELRALGETGQTVSGTLDLARVLDLIASRAVALGPADGCALFRYERADRTFSPWRATGLGEEYVDAIRQLRIREDETAMGRALAERRPVIVPDLVEAPSWPLRDASVAAGLRTVLIVPLIRADRMFGALVLYRKGLAPFEPRTVDLMQTFANQSVLAIQNARLFREIEENGRQLEVASQHKSQFLANMSHELRTPLNAVLGYAELLADGLYGELPGKATGVLERIQANGQHLLALINDVLDLSKIEAGQLTLSLDDYALPSLVQSVVTVAEPLAKAKGLDLKVELAERLPIGHGDERRLTQVVLNLVGNAVKFTDFGSVAISARAADDGFELSVTDTGPGIAPADQARIFDAFQQVDNTSTRRKGGTGLGLAISKRIVEMHGGALTVESAPGRGSTFRLLIPIRVELFKEAAE